MDEVRGMAMNQLGSGLSAAGRHTDALSVKEAELAMERRIGSPEGNILGVQCNLANSYQMLGRLEEALSMKRHIYSGRVKLQGEEHPDTLVAALNYSSRLGRLKRHAEAKAVLRKTIPMARRVLGDTDRLTLKMRRNYAMVLYKDAGATLDDLREAVTTLEDAARIARRVMGGAHPTMTVEIEGALRDARIILRARGGA